MKRWLFESWFLVGIVLVLLVGFAVPELVRPITERIAPRIPVACVLLLMAVSLDSSRLWEAFSSPGPALLAAGINIGAIPLVAWGLSHLQASADYRYGLMIAASVPCTLASAAVWTRRAGGDDAVALLVTISTNLLCFLVTPVWLLLTTDTDVELHAGQMMVRLAVVVLAPTLVGQLVRTIRSVASWSDRWKSSIGTAAQAIILLTIMIGTVRAGGRVGSLEGGFAWGAFLLAGASCLTLHLAGLSGGLVLSGLLGFARPQRAAVAFASSQKTLPIGVLLATSPEYFGLIAPLAILPMLVYHVGQLVVDTFIADRLASRSGIEK